MSSLPAWTSSGRRCGGGRAVHVFQGRFPAAHPCPSKYRLERRAAELYYKEVDTLLFELTHNGPVSAEMSALAEAASVSRATLYRYFGSLTFR